MVNNQPDIGIVAGWYLTNEGACQHHNNINAMALSGAALANAAQHVWRGSVINMAAMWQ